MIDREAQAEVRASLRAFPAVGVVGSRQSGKTTLARGLVGERGAGVYLDLEKPSDLAKLDRAELFLRERSGKLVVIDEVQRRPELFPILRALIDEDRRPGRFLILGSASPDLLRQSSETLAGRIRFHELTPFSLGEVVAAGKDPARSLRRLWERGGYPRSYLSRSRALSQEWREAFIQTFLERDVPQLGFRVSATRMRRFWEMLAHVHGQLWNASTFARNFDVSSPTVKHHLDLLTDTFLVRQLQPLHVNLRKRLVKSPKVYVRDSGLLHSLLRIGDLERLQGHPALGASFEGFAIEQMIARAPPGSDVAFYRSHTGDEIDLVVTRRDGQRLAIEVKYTAAPRLTPHFHRAFDDIGADRGFVVTAGDDEFPLARRVRAVPLLRLLQKQRIFA
jgi:predicted AAA+ superfamily ATPase